MADLPQIIESFNGKRILVVGDLILDHYIWGSVDRISPEAPVVVVRVSDESRRLGGAANVVSNLSALGAQVTLCGVVGDDDPGNRVLGLLEDQGVSTKGIVVDPSRVTTRKTRVIAHAQQVVRVDREVDAPMSEELQSELANRIASSFDEVDGVIVSDYAKGTLCAPVFNEIEQAFDRGVLGLSAAPLLIDPKMPNFSLYSRATVIKPNKKEAQEATGCVITNRKDALLAAQDLVERWNCPMILITLGELGMVLASRCPDTKSVDLFEIDTVSREVYDVSGAGDTVSATFLLALAVGAGGETAASLANIAAGVVVGEVSTVPISLDGLNKAIL